MKRDLDLVRNILIALEEKNAKSYLNYKNDNYSDEKIEYNSYLILQAGLAEGVDFLRPKLYLGRQ